MVKGTFPFLTSYDPPGSAEGSIDPLGLYLIADQLATQLVPIVRERMQRIRFLTAIAIGALVIEEIEETPVQRDASPFLVWEWLVVEAFVRSMGEDSSLWGVPGTLVARRAIDQHGYLDARSYLKTPRVFGFHGVYKRMAVDVGLVETSLAPGKNARQLADVWARDLGLGDFHGATSLRMRWKKALERCLGEKSPRTKCGWSVEEWAELAAAFEPSACKARERQFLRELLLNASKQRLSALPALWELQAEFEDHEYGEELLHRRLGKKAPHYVDLLSGIRTYEAFARSLQDAFDALKATAATLDGQAFVISDISADTAFRDSVAGLHRRFEEARAALGSVSVPNVSLQSIFDDRFGRLASPLDASKCASELCLHHEDVQRRKSADGKRPWFDRLGVDRIYIRHAYREPRRDPQPDRYVHDYRGHPIRRFCFDLS